MELVLFALGILFCVGVLPGLLLGLALAGAFRKPPRTPQPEAIKILDLVAQQLDAWVAAERLPFHVAQQIRALIAADRAALQPSEQPVVPVPLAEPTVPLAAAQSAPLAVQSAPADAVPNVPPALAATVEAPPDALPSALSLATKPQQSALSQQRRRLAGALLALGTRRTLLYLGTFLLGLSGLTLVIFNWASFAPPIQTALLVGITAAIWGGGAWMTHRPDLARAGTNLQAVAGLLVPVAAFAFSRPGMLDLVPRTGWLFVALACLPIYAVAAWRTRNSFYSVAAALAGANAFLAGLGAVPNEWLPAWLIGLLTIYLLVGSRLQALGRPDLAAGLYWTAHIGVPSAVVTASAVWFAPQASITAFAGAWAATAIFYIVAAWNEDRRAWGWAAALVTLIAVYTNLYAWFGEPTLPLEAAVMAVLAVIGLQVALMLRPQRPNIWIAPLIVALIPAASALSGAIRSVAEARFALPVLMLGGFLLLRAARRGRLDGLPVAPADLDGMGFLVVAAIFPGWIGVLLALAELSTGMFWLIMLALALPAFAAAYWWPGRLRPAYDWTLQGIGGLLVLTSGAILLFEPEFWRAASLVLAPIMFVQAWLRRHQAWSALALAGVLLIGAAFLEYSAFRNEPTAWQFLGLGYTALYALGATLLRRRLRAEWLAPALIGAAIVGGETALFALYTLLEGPTAGACITLVALGALLVALSRFWREARLGYPAVVLLTIGLLTAAAQGFFIGWAPGGTLAYIVLALAIIFGVAGLFLRRRAPAFALPYELATLVLLPVAPLATGGSPAHLTFSWIILAAVYAVITERYRSAWFALASWVCLDLALLQGLAWRTPQVPLASLGIALGGLAWVQGSIALLLRPAAQPGMFRYELMRAGFVALALSGSAAVVLALPEPLPLAIVAFTLLALLILVATLAQSALAAWLTLPLLALGLIGLHNLYELALTTRLLITTCAALALTLFGWALARSPYPAARVWDAPLRIPPLGIGLLSGLTLIASQIWNDAAGLSLALALWGLLWLVGGLRERRPWAALPAVTAGNLALLNLLAPPLGSFSSGLLTGAAFTLAAGEGALAAALRHTFQRRMASIGRPLYVAAGLMGALALLFGLGNLIHLAAVALGLALLVGLLTTIERREAGVWAALGLGIMSFVVFGAAQGWHQDWVIAWSPVVLISFVALGFVLERLGFHFWRRPTTIGVAVAGGVAVLALFGTIPALERLNFTQAALAGANLGLLWATVAVRLRSINLGYAAGAAFVGAALCRLADLGVAEPQWYVVPSGLYLLALGAGLRHFQGRRRASQVLELAAALLIMGASFAQALRIPGGPGYELLLFGEALAFMSYGTLLRLRIPFVMGVAFFVAGSSWLALEVSRGFNQWVLLGIFGILMIATYVVLERHQERLVRLGRTWMLELRSWA